MYFIIFFILLPAIGLYKYNYWNKLDNLLNIQTKAVHWDQLIYLFHILII